ncbi:MAG: hypothetical protein ILA34_01540 [Bacteroidaceae bacterium]|nr:hypothetical protein [Bacteroidaceae bacterium]
MKKLFLIVCLSALSCSLANAREDLVLRSDIDGLVISEITAGDGEYSAYVIQFDSTKKSQLPAIDLNKRYYIKLTGGMLSEGGGDEFDLGECDISPCEFTCNFAVRESSLEGLRMDGNYIDYTEPDECDCLDEVITCTCHCGEMSATGDGLIRCTCHDVIFYINDQDVIDAFDGYSFGMRIYEIITVED